MNFQTVVSIALLATLASTAQGLLLKSAIKSKLPALPSILPNLGALTSPLSGAIQAEPVPSVRFVPTLNTVPAPVPVYTYAQYEYVPAPAPVYYTEVRPVVGRRVFVRAGKESLTASLGNLISGSARTIGDIGTGIKEAVGNVLSSSGPPTAEVYYSAY